MCSLEDKTGQVEAENFVSHIWVPETIGSQWCNRLRRIIRDPLAGFVLGKRESEKREGGGALRWASR
jgi:hypothetical protein